MVRKLNNASQQIWDQISAGRKFLLDGATGTYLQKNGLEPGGCPELMNLHSPDTIKKMADTYYSNGSDIALTNTFGGNYYRLRHYGFESEVYKINKAAAKLTFSSSKKFKDKFVFGSIGPTGEFIEPLGSATKKEMYNCFYEQMSGLYDGGVHGFLIETQIATEETLIAIEVAKENFDLITIASFVFDKGPRGFFTMFGLSPEESIEMFFKAGADVVGANCGNGSEKMVEISEIFREVTDKPILVQANAGIPIIKKNDIIYPESPEFMRDQYKKLLDLNVNFLGGCCGTNEKHINEFSKIIRSHNER